MSDVFISYSRKDAAFVHRLYDALLDHTDLTPEDIWIDWQDIQPSTQWLDEIYAAIVAAETFLIIVTPNALASEYCNRELDYALINKKRILPILRREIDRRSLAGVWIDKDWETLARENLDKLLRIQFISLRKKDTPDCECQFDEDRQIINPACDGPECDLDDFEQGLQLLIDAHDADVEYIKIHTRYLTRAHEWKDSGDHSAFLLRGRNLDLAETWLNASIDKDPTPSELQVEYILASRVHQRRQQRMLLTGALSLSVIAIIAAIIAAFQTVASSNNAATAVANADRVATQAAITLSRQLAAQAELARNERSDLLQRSVLLAIESMRITPSWEADRVIRQGLAVLPRAATRIRHPFDPPVFDLAYSPDGRYLGARMEDIYRLGEPLIVWGVETGAEVAQLKPEEFADRLTDFAFSPDGQQVVSIDQDEFMRLWEIIGAREIRRWTYNYDRATAVEFSPDGRNIISVHEDNSVRFWVVTTGREVRSLPFEDDVTVRLSPGGSYAVVIRQDEQDETSIMSLVDLATAEEVMHLDLEAEAVGLFSMNSSYLAVMNPDGSVRVWDVAGRTEEGRLPLEDDATLVDVSSDGQYVAIRDRNGTVQVWDVARGTEAVRIGHEEVATRPDWFVSTAFSADGRFIATTTSQSHSTMVWEVSPSRDIASMPNLNGNRAFAVSPNGPLAATSIRSNVVVWDFNTGEELSRLGHDNEIWVVAFSPDGRLLATVDSKAVVVREARTSREIAHLTHPQIVDAIAFSPDGLYLAAGSRDYMARVWEVDSGRMVEGTPLIHTEDVIALRFSDDGQYLVTISRDDILWVWEVRSGRQIGQTSYGSWEDTTVSFTPDGRFLTAADFYENSAESPDDRIVVNMHQNGGTAISQDLRYLARIDGQSNAVRVLEVDSGREIIRMPHELELIAVTFSSDGKYLITATFSDSMEISTILAQRRLWVWLWQPEDLIREACARLTRNLTQAEWEQYMGSLPYRDTC